MSDTVICVESLWKKYRLGLIGTGTLRHDLNRWWHRVRGKPDPYAIVGQAQKSEVNRQKSELTSDPPPSSASRSTLDAQRSDTAPLPLANDEIWALRDISFEVKRGEILGIIGRNGAGKSTLLKVLSRVTAPTLGEAKVKGRIASLLEVGTGFHPELTGRENIFLNGVILGMTKDEIKRKFDEIVAFSEVEKFIDTPVKRYSSGMYVRLAFAVAAHLDPEILIVDEVLAVGDVSFQKKCLGKMSTVARGGRTVLFVSHNMAAVKALCSQALLLDEGALRRVGEVGAIVAAYLQGGRDSASEREWIDPTAAPGNEHIRLEFVRVHPPDGEPVITIDTGAVMEVGFYNFEAGINLDCTVYLLNNDGLVLCETGRVISDNDDARRGSYRVTGHLPPHLLNTGRYYLSVLFGKDQRYPLFRLEEAVSFTVENTATGRASNMSVAPGVIRPILSWSHEFVGLGRGQL